MVSKLAAPKLGLELKRAHPDGSTGLVDEKRRHLEDRIDELATSTFVSV